MSLLSEAELVKLLAPLLPKLRECTDVQDFKALMVSSEIEDLSSLLKHPAVGRNMRAPEKGSVLGEYGGEVMRLVNKFCIQDAAKRFVVSLAEDVQTIVEIGPGGHGYSLEVFAESWKDKRLPNFKHLGLVEISDSFREQCEAHAARLFSTEPSSRGAKRQRCETSEEERAVPTVSISGDDCRDLAGVLGGVAEEGSVDRLFAVNVIYFLDPLEPYLREFRRVLKPQTGRGIFVLKNMATNSEYFHHTDPAKLVEVFEKVGFSVSLETGGTGDRMDDYTALVVSR